MTASVIDNRSGLTMWKLLQERIVALHTKTDADMRKSQARFKLEYDHRVREVPSFIPGSYLFLKNLPMQTLPDASAEVMAEQTYNKLETRVSAPFRIISVQKDKIMIDENGNPRNVSIDRVSHASSDSQPPIHPHNRTGPGVPTPHNNTY